VEFFPQRGERGRISINPGMYHAPTGIRIKKREKFCYLY